MANEELSVSKACRKWGNDMWSKNIGNHQLGSHAYPEKQTIWDKEDKVLRS
jgi:hypothetical protein